MIELASTESCTGCAACYGCCPHDAISMIPDEDEGFLFPKIDESLCVECRLCQRTCPVITKKENNNSDNPKVFALWSNPDRELSSSGGAFSAFARKVISGGGSVFGAAFDENLRLRHVEVTTISGIDKLRGSKYVQSEISADVYKRIRKILKEGRNVLFCGTPCEVAGLKSYLRVDYENLLTLDLICHGVPSGRTFESYIKKLASRVGQKVTGFQFRRLNRWGFAPSVQLNGKFIKIFGVNSLYMDAFDKSALFRKSCYSCPYATIPRQGDCSLGDFWGLGRHGVPFKHDVIKGVSLVMANNEKGLNAINNLENVFKEERSLDEAVTENYNVIHVSVKHKDRDAIVRAFNDDSETLQSINDKFHLTDRSLKGIVKQYAEYLGLFDTVKRAYNWVKTLK